MAKPKPPRGGLNSGLKSGLKKGAAPPEKITPKSFIGALPCLLIVLIGIGLMSLFFYASLSTSLKNAPAKTTVPGSTK